MSDSKENKDYGLVVIALVAGAIVVAISVILYFGYVSSWRFGFSTDDSNWANFGSYFGGFAGTLLSFLALLFISYALVLQTKQLSATIEANADQERILDDQLRLLTQEQRLNRLENLPIKC